MFRLVISSLLCFAAWAQYTPPGGSGSSSVTLTAPISANWTAFNTASMAQTPTFLDSRYTMASNAAAGVNIQGVATALPAAPYTATFRIWPLIGGNASNPAGNPSVQVGWADGTVGTPGKIVTAGPIWVPSGTTIAGANFNSTTSPNSNVTLSTLLLKSPFISSGQPLWMRLTDNNTNWLADYSYDGVNYVNLYTETRNTFATATQLIVMVNGGGSSVSQSAVFDSYATGVP